MMASNVTPLAEDEGAEVDGAVEAEGVAVFFQGRLNLSYASLRRMVASSMTLIKVK